MVKATLLLHFYNEEHFIGQRLLWVEVKSTRALWVLISLLAKGRKPEDLWQGTEEFPTEGIRDSGIPHSLEMAFDQCAYDPAWRIANSVRVMQVSEGWPFEVPHILSM